jgi:quercetin dioxygenase-like cupin family protein
MFTYFVFERGQEISSHSHTHEKLTLILKGEMQFKLGGEIKPIKAGEGVAVPSGIEHKAYAVTAVKVIESWNPVRIDYIVS